MGNDTRTQQANSGSVQWIYLMCMTKCLANHPGSWDTLQDVKFRWKADSDIVITSSVWYEAGTTCKLPAGTTCIMSMVTSKANFYFQAKLVNNYMYISITFCICLLIQDQGYLISVYMHTTFSHYLYKRKQDQKGLIIILEKIKKCKG
jgi:hypothetical protein